MGPGGGGGGALPIPPIVHMCQRYIDKGLFFVDYPWIWVTNSENHQFCLVIIFLMDSFAIHLCIINFV